MQKNLISLREIAEKIKGKDGKSLPLPSSMELTVLSSSLLFTPSAIAAPLSSRRALVHTLPAEPAELRGALRGPSLLDSGAREEEEVRVGEEGGAAAAAPLSAVVVVVGEEGRGAETAGAASDGAAAAAAGVAAGASETTSLMIVEG